MDIFRDLVRDIAIIIVLASFLEMFLPGGSMRSFVRVVMGLFMILTVLNPMLKLMKEDFTFPAFTMVSQETKGILAKGEALAKQNQDKALAEYKKQLAMQVKAVAEMRGQAIVDRVEVELAGEDSGNPRGEFKKVTLFVRPVQTKSPAKDSWIEPVAPVNIDKEGEFNDPKSKGGARIDPGIKDQLTHTLSNFYNLDQGQIEIYGN